MGHRCLFVAGLALGRKLCFGSTINVGRLLAQAACELGIEIHVVGA